nr:aldehyde dehydrogenase family protein [Salipaludibacillus keqinensis]
MGNKWEPSDSQLDVMNKYTLEKIASIGVATRGNVQQAVKLSREVLSEPFSPYERYKVLKQTAELMIEKQEELAQIICEEVGKPITESRGEVARAAMTLEISAEEAKRISGHAVPVEAAPGSERRKAFTIRVPVGVVAAITPFNVPLNLVCHKVGPALAAGNSVVLKPAEVTPLCALKLAELFNEAGLPSGRLNVLTGNGPEIGQWLIDEEDISMFSFTGSPRVGRWLRERAGTRKVALELGNNSATIIHHDADLDTAAEQVALKSFNNAGQVCISVQRVYVHESVKESFLDKLRIKTEALKVGDPSDDKTHVGPMIHPDQLKRVEEWVNEAVSQGAEVVTGNTKQGTVFMPTVLTNVKRFMKVCKDEIFGPVVSILSYEGEDDVINEVNDSAYGLQAGLFTNDLSFAMKAAEKIEVGGLIINDTSGYRVDHMPYGGVKGSGNGKEGPKYAIEEMTNERIIVMNL